MQILESNGLTIVQFPMLCASAGLIHGFSTRLGGVSQDPYDSLNLGLYQGDELAAVLENRRLFVQALGIDPATVVVPRQVHGNVVVEVGTADRGKGFLRPETTVADADALVTNTPGVALFACYADCVPLYFYDPIKGAIGLAHAGWRGTFAGIGWLVVEKMASAFGSQAADLRVGIGPAIGPLDYEVDEVVIEVVQKSLAAWSDVLTPTRPGHARLDLWQANRQILQTAGVADHHITVAGYSTFAEETLFFSHRRAQGPTGRMAGVMMLRSTV